MRISNWVAALGTIIMSLAMACIAWEDYKVGRIFWSTGDLLAALMWFLLAAFIIWRAIRHPNATFARLWNKK